MKMILVAMLVCTIAAVACGRKATPLPAGVPVSTNTVLPCLTEAEVKEAQQRTQTTTQTEVRVHDPTSIDQQERERKRIQRMGLIDDQKKEK